MLITLKDGKTTAVIDSVGAQLISLKNSENTEYIWQRDPEFWNKCSPLLFPIVGNCRNNRTILEREVWEIPKHGFCRDTDFAVTNQEKDCASFEIRDTEKTKTLYPYSFCLSLTYKLHDGVLFMDYKVINSDSRTMHYCLGAHPGFNCPLRDGEAFEDYDLVFEREETASSMRYDIKKLAFNPEDRTGRLEKSRMLPLTRDLFKDDAVYFDDLKSKKVSIVNRNTGKGIEVAFPGFETVAFWTPYPAEAPFICIEPWNGSAVYTTEDDEFIHKNHVQTLTPGDSKSYGLSIRIPED